MNLKRKVGPLPLWGWAAIAGAGLGMLYLVKRSKGATGEPATEAVPLSGTTQGPGETGVGGGGEGKIPAPELLPAAPAGPIEGFTTSPTYVAGTFPGEVADVAEGAKALEALGVVGPRPSATSSTAGAAAQARHKATGGNPRAGLKFKPIKFHGQAAHEYPHAVPGGIGKRHNIIVLPIGKKNHAAKGKHAPKAKPTHHPAAHRRPATHHPTKARPKVRR